MVVVDMIAKNQLLPLAFALVKGENNESWPCSLGLIRKKVLGPGTSICMISNRHHGLFNGAKQHLEGYPPLIHMWCSRHFTINIWKKQRSKEVIIKLKALCKIKDEKKFEARLKELEKYLMMMQSLSCLNNCQRNLSGILLLTMVVLDMGL
jgi:hypothetical protein